MEMIAYQPELSPALPVVVGNIVFPLQFGPEQLAWRDMEPRI